MVLFLLSTSHVMAETGAKGTSRSKAVLTSWLAHLLPEQCSTLEQGLGVGGSQEATYTLTTGTLRLSGFQLSYFSAGGILLSYSH